MNSIVVENQLNQNYDTPVLDEPHESAEDEWKQNSEDDTDGDDDFDINSYTATAKKKNGASRRLNFKCHVDNCELAFRKKCLLEDHIRKHTRERPFQCNIGDCNKTFTKEPHLKRHKIMVHEKTCEQACDVKGCGVVLNNKYSLKKHKLKVHNASNWPFFCNKCSMGFKKKFLLNQHNFKHTGEHPFKCTICNIGFTLQRDLTKHNRNHRTYTCDCGEIFQRWSGLSHHKRNCTAGKKEYVCPACNKKATNGSNLNTHMLVHQNSDKFNCPYMDCNRSYQYKKNLTFHMKVFHERKDDNTELPCPDCGKVFTQKLYLNRHLKTVHNKIQTIPKSRATRKDKGKTKTFTAAVLSGLKLTQKQNIEMLLNPEKILSIRIPKIDSSQKAETIVEVVEKSKNNDMEITDTNQKVIIQDTVINNEANSGEINEMRHEERIDRNDGRKVDLVMETCKIDDVLNLEDAVIELRDFHPTVEESDPNLIMIQDAPVNVGDNYEQNNANFDLIINVNQDVLIEEITVQENEITSISEGTANSDDILLKECSSVLDKIEKCLVSS